ncbi:MAG: hypothetical protein PVF96_00975 [Candidatus Bathyarchaeota archaeon]
MVNCPNCEANIASPVKTWTIPSKKRLTKGEKPKVIMGIFDCSICGTRFRSAVKTKIREDDTVSINNMVERIRCIKGELMQTLKNLREKIQTLESERSNLMVEIDKLKKMADSKVSALEGEVDMLREEVKSLRDLLGYTEDSKK